METRKETLNTIKKCRFCLTNDEACSSLYDKSRIPKSAVSLPLQILSCVSVDVFPSDKMLTYICDRCRFFMDMCYRFKQVCREADETVMQYIQNNRPMEPIPWPSKLARIYKMFNQSPKRSNKMVMNDSKNASLEDDEDSDEDDNVYNIKIGDGPDDDSTCIKVVKAGDKLHITKDDSLKNKKGIKPTPERPFPCKYCNKSFVKSHHHSRHMRVKHTGTVVTSRGPFGGHHTFSCDQCDETFGSQDELIYHSAKHATENLTCPLCHEKFNLVEEVSAHIKTHVDGEEFMCDLCELVFTSKEKLDNHIIMKHEDELSHDQDDDSMDEDNFEDDNINVKQEGDDMIVEIKKPDEFIISSDTDYKQCKVKYSTSEESESENIEMATLDFIPPSEAPSNVLKTEVKEDAKIVEKVVAKPIEKKTDNQTSGILKKAEEIKKKVQKPTEILSNVLIKSPSAAKTKVVKPETATSSVGNDKSLKLLEKELEELCAVKKTAVNPTKISNEVKTAAKGAEIIKSKRPQLHTSTPKPRVVEEKKAVVTAKAVEKKQPERRVLTKENKEPKEKETKVNSSNNKEEEKETTPKVVKNGASEKVVEENVRRSNRASKVKDYAKMVRDRDTSDDETTDDDEEYKESDKSSEVSKSSRNKKVTPKPAPKVTPAAAAINIEPTPRKRGRPRKDVPPKVKKPNTEENDDGENTNEDKSKLEPEIKAVNELKNEAKPVEENPSPKTEETSNLVMSPTGQTLKKVPIKALPPGIKPLPLPVRSVGTGELCEMQIGKKVVKVQKIVMTKAEVEAMAKKGLVEMKYGTMMLKQGIKLPSTDPTTIKSSPVGVNVTAQSQTKRAAPTRCMVDDEA